MSVGYELARFVLEFVSVVKRGDYEWQRQKLEELSELKRFKQTKNAALEHELKMLKEGFAAELQREKYKQQKIVEDYRNFLDSIEEVKHKMLTTYPDMPKPMVLLIHHHAKALLDDMWAVKNKDEKAYQLSEEKFTHFFMTVFEDATTRMEKEAASLPTETLKLIKGQRMS